MGTNDHIIRSTVGQAKVIAEFLGRGYSVFIPFSGREPFDLVIYKDSRLLRVEVKSCNYLLNNAYNVLLKTVTSSTKGNVVTKFDSSRCDVVAIYLEGLDKICFFNPKELHGKNEISLREEYANSKSNIIADYEDLDKAINGKSE